MNSLTLMANSNFLDTLTNLWNSTGFVTGGSAVDIVLKVCMMLLACFFVYLAVVKKFEPNLLLAIAFGMFLINIPGAFEILYPVKNVDTIINNYFMTYGENSEAVNNIIALLLQQQGIENVDKLVINKEAFETIVSQLQLGQLNGSLNGFVPSNVMNQINSSLQNIELILPNIQYPEDGNVVMASIKYIQDTYINTTSSMITPGLFDVLFKGVEWVIFPPLIFLGIGAMTDFGPLIANPKSLLLGAAAQIGIFATFLGALLMGDMFTPFQAASIAIIGGADGPTAIYVTAKLAPEMLGSISIAAYSYMALVPVIQPPIMKLLTTKKERKIRMEQSKPVSKAKKVIFPILVTGIVGIMLPSAMPLLGMLMLGNLIKESGVVPRLVDTASNALINIVTILLGFTVGTKAYAPQFLTPQTLLIMVLGVLAFSIGTASGVLFGKLMSKLDGGKTNPLIGAAGVSAVPMAARVAQDVGKKEDPNNYLLMHAMGPNVAGVIGSAVAAGILLAVFGVA